VCGREGALLRGDTVTIKKLGRRQVALSKILITPHVQERSTAPDVLKMAESIDKYTLLQPPELRQLEDGTYAINYGQDRIAAHIALRRKRVEADIVECTEEEASRRTAVENAYRRHDTKEQLEALRSLVDEAEVEERAKASKEKAEGKKRSGRPRNPRNEAIRRVANETGRNPEALRQRLAEADKPEVPPDCPIETLGIETGPEFNKQMTAVIEAAKVVRNHIVAAEGAATRLEGLGLPPNALGRIKEHLSFLVADLKLILPHSICPWCKGTDPYQSECGACQRTGWVAKHVCDEATKELLDPAMRFVMYHGQLVKLEFEADSDDGADPEEVF